MTCSLLLFQNIYILIHLIPGAPGFLSEETESPLIRIYVELWMVLE